MICSALSAQQSSDSLQAKLPTQNIRGTSGAIAEFKTRTDLVLVPVVVLRKGKAVTGLTKEAFRLEENGREQTIGLFEEMHPPTAISEGARAIDRGYSNLPYDNASQLRLTIIVLDLLNTSILQRTDGRDQIGRFLSKGLVPNQPVSLLCLTSRGLKLVHPFSTDANALVEALRKMSLGPQTIMDRRNVVVHTIEQLEEIAQAYRGIPGRKTMIFAAGYIPEITPEQEMIATSGYTEDLRGMWQSLIDANIALYPVQLMSWSRDPSARGLASRANDILLRDIAEFTGGNLCTESSGLFSCLADAIEDSRSYYMLGFSVGANDRKPGWRDLRVKVSEPHVDARARSGFYYGSIHAKNEQSARREEINALASPLAYGAVPMNVKVMDPALSAQAKASGEKRSVEFLVTVPLNGVRIDSSQANPLNLEVGAIALTSDTREAAEFLHPVVGNPKPDHIEAWGRDGIMFHEKLDLPAGSFDVRFFVRDNNAEQIGTVVFPLEVK